MHGRSQAVRLPKEFRIEGKEVRGSKLGDKVTLEPFEKQPFDPDAFWARLDAMRMKDFDVVEPPDGPTRPDPRNVSVPGK
jgi:antitoxin VapB